MFFAMLSCDLSDSRFKSDAENFIKQNRCAEDETKKSSLSALENAGDASSDPHSQEKVRLERILMAQPKIAKSMGCVSEARHCE
jgi:hypothetical protein